MILVFSAKAQYKLQDVTLEATAYYVAYNEYEHRVVGGVNAHVFLAPNLSVDFRFAIGKRYIHSSFNNGFGAALAVAGMSSAIQLATTNRKVVKKDWAIVTLGILSLVTAEGFTYYVPVTKNFNVAPYVRYISLEYIRNRNTVGQDLFPAGGFGIRLDWMPNGEMLVAPFVEGFRLYGKQSVWGYSAGLSFGYKINLMERKGFRNRGLGKTSLRPLW